jgi:hypothetical protein
LKNLTSAEALVRGAEMSGIWFFSYEHEASSAAPRSAAVEVYRFMIRLMVR